MTLYRFLKTTRCAEKYIAHGLLFISFTILVGTSAALAQSESTSSANPNTKTQFKEELDAWVLRAYEGDRDAQFKAGVLYTNDQFATPNYEQALYWYKQAAKQDHILAQYNLGHQYLNGLGVEQSTTAAMSWWLKSAELGHSLSQFNVGRAYYLGIGLPENQQNAKYWFAQAAKNKEPKSIEIIKQLGWENDINSVVLTPTPTIKKPVTTAAQTDKSASNNGVLLFSNNTANGKVIMQIKELSSITVINESNDWSKARLKNGFPVWVHGDFINVNNTKGSITGNGVNARSQPTITTHNIIGKLKQGEAVTVILQKNKWYQIMSPSRFHAWVKTAAIQGLASVNKATVTSSPPAKTENSARPLNRNSNEWLFSQPTEHYTLQLASFDSPEKVTTFLQRSPLKNDKHLHQFSSRAKNISWTYFLYGSYANKDAAQVVKNKINKNQSWIRNIGKLQQNRCISWKKQIPSPKELNQYCAPKV